jgi:hypothetical protein
MGDFPQMLWIETARRGKGMAHNSTALEWFIPRKDCSWLLWFQMEKLWYQILLLGSCSAPKLMLKEIWPQSCLFKCYDPIIIDCYESKNGKLWSHIWLQKKYLVFYKWFLIGILPQISLFFLTMTHYYYCDVEWMWPCTKCSRLV